MAPSSSHSSLPLASAPYPRVPPTPISASTEPRSAQPPSDAAIEWPEHLAGDGDDVRAERFVASTLGDAERTEDVVPERLVLGEAARQAGTEAEVDHQASASCRSTASKCRSRSST